jgi:hypothetical protein
MRQRRVLWMECQRNESLKAVGLVLHGTQPEQVIDAVFVVLDMTVEHGRVRPQTNLVSGASGVEPLLTVNLVIADDVANAVAENLRPAARQRINTCFLQLFECLANRELGALGQVGYLDHGEGFQVDLRKAFLQTGNEIEKILKRQVGMQSADDVELRHRFAVSGSGGLVGLLQRHRVGARRILLSPKSAETAGRHADIRWIDMPIDIEVRLVPMQALADVIREPSHGKNVASPVKNKRVVTGQAFACQNFLGDGL